MYRLQLIKEMIKYLFLCGYSLIFIGILFIQINVKNKKVTRDK